MDDEFILELFRNRDEQAITHLSEKYNSLCVYVAQNVLSRFEDAEECVNSAYYEVWQNIPPDNPKSLQAYLCRIVKNKALDKVKYNSAKKRSAELTMSLDELRGCVPDKGNPENELLARELGRAISRFLREQDKKHRIIFVRRYWYGDSIAAIAGYYGINEKTVATYLFRTRKKLKSFLKKEGYNYE